MKFQKQDMQEQYNWNDPSGDSVYSGQPSRRLFDRANGHQVLFLINSYGSLSERFTAEEGKMIEYEICHHLPLEARSEISVLNWIIETARQTAGKA